MAECPGTFTLAKTGDGALARLRIPGGVITAAQLCVVADLSEELGNGRIDLTNRANLQVRGLDSSDGPAFLNALRDAGMISPRIVADRYRNITASPLSAEDPTSLMDLAPYVKQLDQALCGADWLERLSVKFSFIFDSGGDLSVRNVPHDVGFIAEGTPDTAYFRLSFAGELSPFCVAPSAASRFALSFARMVALDAKAEGRIAPILQRDGLDKVIRMACELAEDDVSRRRTGSAFHNNPPIPSPGAQPQSLRNKFSFGLGVPMQRLSHPMCKMLATLSEVFGDGTVRLSPWFMVFLPDIGAEGIEEVRSLSRAHGFLTEPEDGKLRIIACAGASGCNRSKLDTKADGANLARSLAGLTPDIDTPMTIHLSGCDRGCAMASPADLLLLAREDAKGYTAYTNAHTRDVEHQQEQATCLTTSQIAQFSADLIRNR